MLLEIEVTDATLAYQVKDKAEAERILSAIQRGLFWRRWVQFLYDGGERVGMIRPRDVIRAGIVTEADLQREIGD